MCSIYCSGIMFLGAILFSILILLHWKENEYLAPHDRSRDEEISTLSSALLMNIGCFILCFGYSYCYNKSTSNEKDNAPVEFEDISDSSYD
mmetsp:Transcript_3731/g.3452  ORF Transcript_3731/g.3452 Transcript_3731/m.3452 type:complete len:91 (+) Transcript_3731:22-294(+)